MRVPPGGGFGGACGVAEAAGSVASLAETGVASSLHKRRGHVLIGVFTCEFEVRSGVKVSRDGRGWTRLYDPAAARAPREDAQKKTVQTAICQK